MEREGWAKVPRYALGGSSGGAFALHLAMRLPLSGVVSVIMAVQSVMLESKPRSADLSKSWPFPSTMYIHMSRDESTTQNVVANVAALKKQVSSYELQISLIYNTRTYCLRHIHIAMPHICLPFETPTLDRYRSNHANRCCKLKGPQKLCARLGLSAVIVTFIYSQSLNLCRECVSTRLQWDLRILRKAFSQTA